jgi:outer membrane protein TolC
MTVEQAVALAATANPQIKALRAAVEVAQQRRAAATDFEDPEAFGGWGDTLEEFDTTSKPSKGNNESRVGGRINLPNPFLMAPRVRARSAEVMAAKADLQSALWLAECDVRRLFAELNYLEADLALAGTLAHDYSELLADVRRRTQEGAATAAEVLSAAQRQIEAGQNLEQARHRYQVAQRDLAGMLDLPPAVVNAGTNALTHLSFPESAFQMEALQAQALSCRGDVAALRWRTVAAGFEYREARNARIPWFKEITAGNREPSDQWWITVGLTVPVFTWTKNHAIDVLHAQSTLAAINETNGVQLVRRELRNALDELEERRREQVRNQNQVTPLLAEMQQTLQLLKATPNLMRTQVTSAEAQIHEAARLEMAAGWQYQLALLNLERVLGEPLAELLRIPDKKT